MACYKTGGCGVYENRSCSDCPASKPEYANKPLYNASIWQELADLKRRIPKDAKIYRVDIRYDNVTPQYNVLIHLDDWEEEYLGILDAPLGYRKYGFYSTKENALAAIKKQTSNYSYPVRILDFVEE